MKKYLFLIFMTGFVAISCATVQVQAPKDPIKMDIAMRLDVYQHVAKDIDDIESLVAGKKNIAWFENLFVQTAYAQDLSPDVLQAVERRKERRAEVMNLLAQGAIGESKDALLVVRGSNDAAGIVSAENQDRMIIYNSIAQKNGSNVSDVQKIYAERLQKDAPKGAPVENTGGWSQK